MSLSSMTSVKKAIAFWKLKKQQVDFKKNSLGRFTPVWRDFVQIVLLRQRALLGQLCWHSKLLHLPSSPLCARGRLSDATGRNPALTERCPLLALPQPFSVFGNKLGSHSLSPWWVPCPPSLYTHGHSLFMAQVRVPLGKLFRVSALHYLLLLPQCPGRTSQLQIPDSQELWCPMKSTEAAWKLTALVYGKAHTWHLAVAFSSGTQDRHHWPAITCSLGRAS